MGSFLNVLIYRLPRNLSPWSGRSKCPHCDRTVRWYENVPLVSWLALRGRCAGCKGPIAWRYPLVELLTGALAAVCVLRFGPTGAAPGYFVFLAALLAIAWIDWEFMIIPDELSLGLTVIGVALAATVLPLGFWRGLLGAAAGAGIIWGVAWGYKRTRGVEGMGFGDVKLAAMIGAFLGPLASHSLSSWRRFWARSGARCCWHAAARRGPWSPSALFWRRVRCSVCSSATRRASGMPGCCIPEFASGQRLPDV